MGINAVAIQAKVSKMLIYRYFQFAGWTGWRFPTFSQNDFWLINFDEELPDQASFSRIYQADIQKTIMWLHGRIIHGMPVSLENWQRTISFVGKSCATNGKRKNLAGRGSQQLSKHPKKRLLLWLPSSPQPSVIWHCSKKTARSTTASRFSKKAAGEELEEGINPLVDLWLQKRL